MSHRPSRVAYWHNRSAHERNLKTMDDIGPQRMRTCEYCSSNYPCALGWEIGSAGWMRGALPPHLPRKYLERASPPFPVWNIRVWRTLSLSLISSHVACGAILDCPNPRQIVTSLCQPQELPVRWRGESIITSVRVESREQRESRVWAGAGWVGISVAILHLQLWLRSEEWGGNWGRGGFEVTKGKSGKRWWAKRAHRPRMRPRSSWIRFCRSEGRRRCRMWKMISTTFASISWTSVRSFQAYRLACSKFCETLLCAASHALVE